MDDISSPDASGTTPAIRPAILAGKRRRLYSQDERLVMISQDKFDNLESAIGDRGIFSHLAVGFLSASLPLVVEMLVDWWFTEDEVSAVTAVIGGGAVALGILFAVFVALKNHKVRQVRESLFADRNLVDDRTILEAADGTSFEVDHLSQGVSGPTQFNEPTAGS